MYSIVDSEPEMGDLSLPVFPFVVTLTFKSINQSLKKNLKFDASTKPIFLGQYIIYFGNLFIYLSTVYLSHSILETFHSSHIGLHLHSHSKCSPLPHNSLLHISHHFRDNSNICRVEHYKIFLVLLEMSWRPHPYLLFSFLVNEVSSETSMWE